jgi:hypothetical protein
MTMTQSRIRMKVADEVWIATALLHRKYPERFDFSIEEIVENGRDIVRENTWGPLRPGFYVHVVQHCVANRPPQPGRYRMLIETEPGRRRLYRPGDYYNPEREGSKITPSREHMPLGYSGLIGWYRDWCKATTRRAHEEDPLLALRGSGAQLWADEHADEFVKRIREGWE